MGLDSNLHVQIENLIGCWHSCLNMIQLFLPAMLVEGIVPDVKSAFSGPYDTNGFNPEADLLLPSCVSEVEDNAGNSAYFILNLSA